MKWLIPPVLVAILLAMMVAVARFLPFGPLVPPPAHWAGLLVLFVGIGLLAAGSRRFFRVGTEINTFREPKILVTEGVFAYSRNPMYLGFLVLLIGAAILINSPLNLVLVVAFFLVANSWYIPFEEANARRVFGRAYVEYCSRVRRWL
ncbi:isoprenylcysteine carboxylmethyltransferase family protein [Stappia sp. GBMRC 2046]|uniref:Isoprenylcysteine carboxylmethyltransferase family protein n=1 Tax=Stappia sediminis TaxID=2692190 RepID=A0A7X3LV23_9HYPH|nr:isoprenylcysteine carboxylmethyltransferase family protein [Stappia sediminis]MXN65603.1 isoprenylcysteine carboxylmethyltransferase family protein [Stappia sediminis]